MAASTALNQKDSGVKSVEPEKKWRKRRLTGKIAALTALNREKERRKLRWTEQISALKALNRKIAALTALNQRNSGVKGVELEK